MNSTNNNNQTINLSQTPSGVDARLNYPTDFTETHSWVDAQLNQTALLEQESEVQREAARVALELDNEFFAQHPQPTLQESRAFLEQDAMLRQFSFDQPDGNSEDGDGDGDSEDGEEDEDMCYICNNINSCVCIRNIIQMDVVEEGEEEAADLALYEHKRQGTGESFIQNKLQKSHHEHEVVLMDISDDEEEDPYYCLDESEDEDEDDIEIGAFGSFICSHGTNCKTNICEECLWYLEQEGKRSYARERYLELGHRQTKVEVEVEVEDEEEVACEFICRHGINCVEQYCPLCVQALAEEREAIAIRHNDGILKLCSACIEESFVNYEGIMPPLTRQKCVSSDDWIRQNLQPEVLEDEEDLLSIMSDTEIQPLDEFESAMFRCWHRVDYTQECDKCRQALLALPPLTRLKAFHGDASDLVGSFEGAETEEFVINVVLEDEGAEKPKDKDEDEVDYGPIDPDDYVYDPAISVVENQYRRNMRDLKDLYEYHPWNLSEALVLQSKLLAYEHEYANKNR